MKTMKPVPQRRLFCLLLMAFILPPTCCWADYVSDLATALGVPASSVFIKSATVAGSGSNVVNNSYPANTKYDDTAALIQAMAALVSPFNPDNTIDVPIAITTKKTFSAFRVNYEAYVMVNGVRQKPTLSGYVDSRKTATLTFKVNKAAWQGPVKCVIECSLRTYQFDLPQSGLSVTVP